MTGTANDLAMAGARPLVLSLGLILEEGLELAVLRRIVASLGEAARRCGVSIVTGDTKVVERGKGTGLSSTPAASACCRWTSRSIRWRSPPATSCW